MNKLDVIKRGESAQHLLSNPVALDALEAVQKDCFLAWCGTQPDEKEAREHAYQLFVATRLLREKLETWAGDAKVEISNARAHSAENALYN